MNAFKFHLQEASMREANSKISAFTGQIIETERCQTSRNFRTTQVSGRILKHEFSKGLQLLWLLTS